MTGLSNGKMGTIINHYLGRFNVSTRWVPCEVEITNLTFNFNLIPGDFIYL